MPPYIFITYLEIIPACTVFGPTLLLDISENSYLHDYSILYFYSILHFYLILKKKSDKAWRQKKQALEGYSTCAGLKNPQVFKSNNTQNK